MEEDKFIVKAKELREKLGEKKKQETEQQTKQRMKSVLSSRDKAMRQIWDYQDVTGMPTPQETEKNFLENEMS
jgi:hypothetical protein